MSRTKPPAFTHGQPRPKPQNNSTAAASDAVSNSTIIITNLHLALPSQHSQVPCRIAWPVTPSSVPLPQHHARGNLQAGTMDLQTGSTNSVGPSFRTEQSHKTHIAEKPFDSIVSPDWSDSSSSRLQSSSVRWSVAPLCPFSTQVQHASPPRPAQSSRT